MVAVAGQFARRAFGRALQVVTVLIKLSPDRQSLRLWPAGSAVPCSRAACTGSGDLLALPPRQRSSCFRYYGV